MAAKRSIFLFSEDDSIDCLRRGDYEARLLGQGDGTDVIKQFVPGGTSFYLDSAAEWRGFEFIYILEGQLSSLASDPPTLLGPGAYIARQNIEERSWFSADTDTVLLTFSSRPSFHIMREETQQFFQLASKVETDQYLDGHCKRVEKLAIMTGERLGLAGEQLYNLRYAAFFHDLGKSKVPKGILQKPSKLEDEEWMVMEKHATWGREILEQEEFLQAAARIVEQIHERVDGHGYPHGLHGDGIALEAKIIAVVDAYDAMTNDRPYRKALSQDEAIRELQKNAGRQFDAAVVEAFLEVLKDHDPSHMCRHVRFDQELARYKQQESFLRITEEVLAGQDLQAVLDSVVNAITQYTPFRRAALALYDRPLTTESVEEVAVAQIACAGLTTEEEAQLRANPLPPEERAKIFREEFRLNGSYYIPHDRSPWAEQEFAGLIQGRAEFAQGGDWHPDDLLIPLCVGARIIGTISVDDPVDGRAPTGEALEPIEVFANLAALAIEKARHIEELRQQATHDQLTEAYNRHYFAQLLQEEEARARRYRFPISLVMIDFDNFREVNNSCGHLEGDRVLREAAELFRSNVREVDTLVRYGGDEFLIVMPESSREGAEQAGERLKQRLSEEDLDVPCRITISVGVATWDPDGDKSFDEVLEEADRWMYQHQIGEG